MFLGLCVFVAAHLIWAAQPTVAHSIRPFSRAYTKPPTGEVSASWYTSWHAQDIPLTAINWYKYTLAIYASALTTPNASEIGLQDSDMKLIPQFVQSCHHNNVIPMLSIGGSTGSRFFSPAVATDANRTAFANAILEVVSQYQLGGIEIDWEYPAKQVIGCNVVSSNDSANFLLFLQTLRSKAPNLIVSAAVSLKPFLDSNSNPMSDVSEFAKVLDYIEIMNYAVWGRLSNTVGPNAPLDDSCAPASAQQGSAVSAVQAWTKAGFPANQIILGVPSYGHSFRVKPSDALPASGYMNFSVPFNKANQPTGDKWDSTASGVDICGNPNVIGGDFNFWGLIDAGFLNANGTPSNGIYSTFDECSKTPFVYNSTSEVMVSYDNADSFAQKGKFIHELNLAGFAMYETGGDYNNILLDAILLGLHIGSS